MSSRSFGRPEPAEKSKDGEEQQPTPVLHVGEVHAELRLTISEETLRDLGSQIASMLAAAAKQGFEHGLVAAMDAIEGDGDGGQGGELTVPNRHGVQVDLTGGSMTAGDMHLSEADIERVRRSR